MNARADDPGFEADMPTRDVPWSQDAEQSVLGGLMLDNAAFDRIGDLIAESDFYTHQHRRIFAAISALTLAGKAADTVTVWQWLQDADAANSFAIERAYVDALALSVPGASNIRRYAEIVREKAMQRALIATADKAVTIAMEPGQVGDRLERIVGEFDRLLQKRVTTGPRDAASIVVQRLDHYTALSEGTAVAGYSTGLVDVDAALNGGLQEGRVYVLAARPSIGKSSLSLQIGLHWAAELGRGVLVLSQEMPAEEVVDRAVANLGRVDYGAIQRGTFEDCDWTGMTEATDKLGRIPLWIDDQPALTLAEIRAKAFAMRRAGLKLVIVDYLQLCSGNGAKGATRNSELEEITRGVKSLAKQLGITVILLSQLSREVEKRATSEPTLADLRDSGAIEQDADAVFGLWFVRQLGETKVMGLAVLKNRQGERGQRIPLEFVGRHQLWWSSTHDINPVAKVAGKKGGFE